MCVFLIFFFPIINSGLNDKYPTVERWKSGYMIVYETEGKVIKGCLINNYGGLIDTFTLNQEGSNPDFEVFDTLRGVFVYSNWDIYSTYIKSDVDSVILSQPKKEFMFVPNEYYSYPFVKISYSGYLLIGTHHQGWNRGYLEIKIRDTLLQNKDSFSIDYSPYGFLYTSKTDVIEDNATFFISYIRKSSNIYNIKLLKFDYPYDTFIIFKIRVVDTIGITYETSSSLAKSENDTFVIANKQNISFFTYDTLTFNSIYLNHSTLNESKVYYVSPDFYIFYIVYDSIFGIKANKKGQIMKSSLIISDSFEKQDMDILWDGERFLIVYSYFNPDNGTWDIGGLFVDTTFQTDIREKERNEETETQYRLGILYKKDASLLLQILNNNPEIFIISGRKSNIKNSGIYFIKTLKFRVKVIKLK